MQAFCRMDMSKLVGIAQNLQRDRQAHASPSSPIEAHCLLVRPPRLLSYWRLQHCRVLGFMCAWALQLCFGCWQHWRVDISLLPVAARSLPLELNTLSSQKKMQTPGSMARACQSEAHGFMLLLLLL